MACYKNETKHKCSKVVMIISVVAIVMGLLTAIFGFMKSGGADKLVAKAEDASGKDSGVSMSEDLNIPTNAAIGALIIIGGIMTIVTGVFGGLTVKFKKVYFAVPFVAMSFIVALLLLIGAAIALAGSGELVVEACNFLENDEDFGMKPALMYTNIVETNMCSDVCPCEDTFKDKFETLTAEQTTSLGGRAATDFVFKPKGDGVYTEFKTCYEANTDKMKVGDTKAKAQEWLKTKGSAALTALEDMFKDQAADNKNCASMCSTPVFYWSRSIENGPAETDCLNAFVKDMTSGTMPAGAVALLSGLALIVAGIGGFPLCTGFNDKKDDN